MHKSIKPLVAVVLTGIGSALVFSFKTTDPELPTAAKAPTSTQPPSATQGQTSTQSPTATKAPTTATGGTTSTTSTPTVGPTAAPTANATTAEYADGTYTGAAISEPWGTFEVQAVIAGGKLTGVQLVASPNDRHSNQINHVAVPLLTQAALAAQSANVDLVSGATWTSESYAESLQSALDAAHAAAVTTQQVAA